jgi:AcrR family transcriptional regulator
MRAEVTDLPRKPLPRIKASISQEMERYSPSARKIILAAQQLFAERGIDAVSLREIATAAGHANNSAVQYHFQSKEGLIQAIFDLRIPFLESARQRHIDSLPADGHGLEDLLAALLFPILEMFDAQEQRIFTLFSSHLLSRDTLEHPFYRAQDRMPVTTRLNQMIEDSLSHLPKQVFDFRFRLVSGFFLSTLLERQNAQRSRKSPYADDSVFWGDMVNVLAAMLREPFRAEGRALIPL